MEPSQQRIAEYELKFKELMNGGGHMLDFVALEKAYSDVVEFKKRAQKEPRVSGP